MKLKYLGTAAAEGTPALFCSCEVCKRARRLGGRNIRTRSQALVNGSLMIDFPCDTYWHITQYDIDLLDIHHCIITHEHEDHFYPDDMHYLREGFAVVPEGWGVFTVCGSEDIREEIERAGEVSGGRVEYRFVRPFEPFEAAGLTVTPLRARHGTPNPYIYIISDGRTALLYANDTGLFPEETWDYLAGCGVKLGLVSMDCTGGAYDRLGYDAHMCIGNNIECRARLRELGLCTDETRFVLNHFSHNGLSALYDDFVKIAGGEGFITSYDGMEIEF